MHPLLSVSVRTAHAGMACMWVCTPQATVALRMDSRPQWDRPRHGMAMLTDTVERNEKFEKRLSAAPDTSTVQCSPYIFHIYILMQ